MGLDLPGGTPHYQGASGFNGNIMITRNHGFRCFRYHPHDGGRLTSLVYDKSVWTSGINHAIHLAPFGGRGRSTQKNCPFPWKGCSHGFYAYYGEDYFERGHYNVGTVRIDGVIDGFGRCVIGNKGYRSEYAVIVAFTKPYVVGGDYLSRFDIDLDEVERRIDAFLERAFPSAPIFPSVEALKAVIPLDGRPPRNDEDE